MREGVTAQGLRMEVNPAKGMTTSMNLATPTVAQSMVCGQSGLMVHAPRPVIMESGQGTGHVLDHTVEDVIVQALMSCKWSAMRDLAEAVQFLSLRKVSYFTLMTMWSEEPTDGTGGGEEERDRRMTLSETERQYSAAAEETKLPPN